MSAFCSSGRKARIAFVLPAILLGVMTVCAGTAEAHVKWFAPYDVASQPRVLEKVLTPDLFALTLLAVSVMLLGYVLDRTAIGESLSRSLDRVTRPARENASVLLRAVAAFFLIAVWTLGGIILTPELKTTVSWIPSLQLAMAASLVSRRSAIFTGCGIIVLFGIAIHDYGLFHLLDYPIFLGVAAYLIADGIRTWRPLPFENVDLIRYTAAVTLMWASIEKWAYPEWTLPIYAQHPELTMGYDFELFMQAAGVIEFTLAFALLGPSLVRRSASFVLLGMFISAIFGFGKIDAVGHALIIAVLTLLAADPRRKAPATEILRGVAMPGLGYAAAFVGFLALYYGIHAVMFRTAII